MKVAILTHPGQYNVLASFSQSLQRSLNDAGVECLSFIIGVNFKEEDLSKLLMDPPDFLITFNGMFADAGGKFLGDHLKIKQVFWLVDAPFHFTLNKSPYAYVVTVDKTYEDFLNELGWTHTSFLPHAVDKALIQDVEQERDIEAAFFSTCIDPGLLRQQWHQLLPATFVEILDRASEELVNDFSLSPLEAFITAFKEQNKVPIPEHLHNNLPLFINEFSYALQELDLYQKGSERLTLINNIEESINVHIFGDSYQKATWHHCLKNKKNVVIHEALNFEDTIATMRRSKIVLNSCSSIRYGLHERILTAGACGAVIATIPNDYLITQFTDRTSALFLNPKEASSLNEKLTSVLTSSSLQHSIVQQAMDIIIERHTWDKRAKELIEFLESIY